MKKRKMMSVLPLLSLQCINKGKSSTRRRNNDHHHPEATSPSDCVSFFVLPISENRSWGGVLILKLRCHLKGIRNGNRMPASGNRPWLDVIFSCRGICYCFRQRRSSWSSIETPAAAALVCISTHPMWHDHVCGVNWIYWLEFIRHHHTPHMRRQSQASRLWFMCKSKRKERVKAAFFPLVSGSLPGQAGPPLVSSDDQL